MTNIKGLENFKVPALKSGQDKSSVGTKPADGGQSFESQLKDAVDSAGTKPPEEQKPAVKPDADKEEAKAPDKLPTEGFPVMDITVPIPADESGETDLICGLTERSAAVITEIKTAINQPMLPQQAVTPITGEEGQNVPVQTEPQVKVMGDEIQDAPVIKETAKLQSDEAKPQSEAVKLQSEAAKPQSEAAKPDVYKAVPVQDSQPSVERMAAERPETVKAQPQSQPQTQKQGLGTEVKQNSETRNTADLNVSSTVKAPGTEAASMADVKILSVSEQVQEVSELKKTEQPTELIQDVSVLKQEVSDLETIVKIKVAEPYMTLDAEAVKQMAAKIANKAAAGGKELIIQLTPENLGRISIKIAAESDGVRIVLGCENQKTMSLLADKAAGIAHIVENNLNQQAVVEIKEDGYWNQQKNATDQHSRQNQEQQSEQHNTDTHQDETDNFIQQLRLGMQRNEEAV